MDVLDVDFHHPSNAHISIRVIYPPLRTTCTSDTLSLSINHIGLDRWIGYQYIGYMDGWMDCVIIHPMHWIDWWYAISIYPWHWMDGSTNNWIK